MFICFILLAVDWIGSGGWGVGGGDGVDSFLGDRVGGGVCGEVYCAGYALTSRCLGFAWLL